MRRQIFLAAVILTVILFFTLARAASAQVVQPASRWSFGGTVGAGQTWDDESSLGTGVLAGGYASGTSVAPGSFRPRGT